VRNDLGTEIEGECMTTTAPTDLTWMELRTIRDLIAAGELSPVEVTEHFLARIAEHDGKVKTFRVLDADGARAQAREAEAAVRRGEALGALHGIPFSVKEHIALAGFPLMNGTGREPTSTRSNLGVQRLLDAGAIAFGTNTMMGTQIQMRSEEGPGVYSTFNWDAEARNPWDRSRVPGWSSSGGASAVASGLVPLAIGSDGGGSTRLPAAYSGVVGVHPTAGLIPWTSYDVPLHAPMMMTTGPLTRHVADAALALQVMAGPDGRDFSASPLEPPDFSAQLGHGVEGLRFAWTDDYGFTEQYAQEESPRVIAHGREAAAGFTALGAEVVTTTEAWEDFWPGFLASTYLFPTGGPAPERPDRETWNAALDLRQRNWLKFRSVLAEHDLLLSVTSQLLARTVEEWEACWTTKGTSFTPHGTFAPVYTSHTHMFNWLGFPAMSVPCGFVDGLPVGLQIVGLPGREPLMFRAAEAFQQAYPQLHVPPTVAP
jgi:aspartyl-tRNA(Asn)/glutamyl-tRNA(Gln) amidotransferase subunit A